MSEFVDYLHEVFEPFGPIEAKRLFGGHGIYHDELMFALVANDVLYFKADADSVDEFSSRGLEPFEYSKQGKLMKLSYYQAPEEIFDDPDEALTWARRAFAAALRAKKS